MRHRARRSSSTNDATDLTNEPWAACTPLVVTPSPNGGRPTDSDRARSSTYCAPNIAPAVNGASSGCSADAFGSLLFRPMES